jgi:hypothetical protein
MHHAEILFCVHFVTIQKQCDKKYIKVQIGIWYLKETLEIRKEKKINIM